MNKEELIRNLKYLEKVNTFELKMLKNRIGIPNGITNGDIIKVMFGISDDEISEDSSTVYVYTKTKVLKGGSQDFLRQQITFIKKWWNAPYRIDEKAREKK